MTKTIRSLVILQASCFALAMMYGAPVSGGPAATNASQTSSVPRNIQFANVTTEAGLSAEFVHTLIQDSKGYLWFGTQDGLNRFDGQDMVVYEHEPDNPNSLSSSFIWSLYLDDQGDLWVGTNRGVNKYDYVTDEFTRNPLGLEPALSDMRIRALTQDRKGIFWLGTVDRGLLSVDTRDGTVVHFTHDAEDLNSLPHDQVIVVHQDRKGRMWVGTDGGGLAQLDQVTGAFTVFRHQPDVPSSLSGDQIRSMFEDRAGRIWIGTAKGGLNVLDNVPGSFKHYRHDPQDPNSLGSGQIPSIFEDADGTLWVGTESGLSESRPSIRGFVHYRNDSDDLQSLVNDRVNAMIQDASGVLWLATHGGISNWNYFSDLFGYLRTDLGFLESDIVTSIAESSDGKIWVGTYGGGLTRISLATGEVLHYRSDPTDPTSLADDRVMVVHVDTWDQVWVGTRNGGLNLLNEDGTGFRRMQADPDDARSLSGNAIASINTDRNGTLWVGVFDGGLNRAEAADYSRFDHFRHEPDDSTSLSSDRVLALHIDRNNELWIGTEDGGMNRFDPVKEKFTRFRLSSDLDPSQTAGTAWEIMEARDGTFWIGTMGSGLLRWDRQDRKAGLANFRRYGKRDGLAQNIFAAVEGADGEIWLSSSNGLYRFDPATLTSSRFDRKNGLRGTEFNQGAGLRIRGGSIMFGGTSGIVGFYPGELPQNMHIPQISITAHSRDAQITRAFSSGSTPQVELGYLDPFISFDFAALDFVSPDKNRHRFRLAGFDAEWTEVDRFRRATYTNLPSGSYVFEVQAANNDNVWNREGAAIDIVVTPPPWQRWWAYLSYGLIITSLIGWYFRKQQLKGRLEARRRIELEQQVQERTSELAARNEQLQQLNEQLAEASVTDSLTGLRNRRYVDEFIATEVSMVERRLVEGEAADRAGEQRDSSRLLFFMMIDLDGFKLINDSYGHLAGDRVLVEVKDALEYCCRESDVIIRWGGDEFMIVGHASSFSGVKVLAERVRESVAERNFDVGNGVIGRLSASIGIAPYPFSDNRIGFDSWEQAVAVADQATYLAKENGRNAWVSIRGSDLLDPADMPNLSANLITLHEGGRIQIDTSIEGGVALGQPELVQDIA